MDVTELTVRRKRMDHNRQSGATLSHVGIAVSIALSLASLIFSTGVLWQRVQNVETNMDRVQLRMEKENGDISAILQKLSAIEVRLEQARSVTSPLPLPSRQRF
jgi:hypothetical protein